MAADIQSLQSLANWVVWCQRRHFHQEANLAQTGIGAFHKHCSGTTDHCHLSDEYWVFRCALPIHYFPTIFQPAKCLLHHPPCAYEAIVKATLLGSLACLIALHTSGCKGKGGVCNHKWLHVHLQKCPWRMCKPLTADKFLEHNTVLSRVAN